MVKVTVFAIALLAMSQIIVKSFNYYGIYYSLIPTAITIVGSYLFIKNQIKSNEK